MTNEVQNEGKTEEIRKTRLELLIEMANHMGKILSIDVTDEKVRRSIENALERRDEMLMWAQTGFHMFDRQQAEKEAELAKQKESEDVRDETASPIITTV